MKKFCTLALVLTTMLVYGQKSTLLQNINFRAKELKHSLNQTGDTLILQGERKIEVVDIYNGDFEKNFSVNNQSVKIPIHDIPVGRYATEVKLKNKRIIITLIRHDAFEKNSNQILQEKRIETASSTETTFQDNSIKAFNGKVSKTINDIKKSYWIVYKISNGYGFRKVMRMGDISVVSQMIEQNKIDLKTKSGKHNKLTVWEVYDTSKFLRYKRLNPDYANASNTDYFNSIPYYKS